MNSLDNLMPQDEAEELYRSAGIKRGACKICGRGFWEEFGYQRMGACGDCVEKLANSYSKAHTGRPHPDFASPEELREYNASRRKSATPPKVVIPEALRWEVFDRDSHRCKKCGSGKMLRADHIIPESKGGPTTLENLQTLCLSCNARKGNRA